MAVYGQKLKKYEEILTMYHLDYAYDIKIVKDYQAIPQKLAKCLDLEIIR